MKDRGVLGELVVEVWELGSKLACLRGGAGEPMKAEKC
jgi:ribosomal protein L40E